MNHQFRRLLIAQHTVGAGIAGVCLLLVALLPNAAHAQYGYSGGGGSLTSPSSGGGSSFDTSSIAPSLNSSGQVTGGVSQSGMTTSLTGSGGSSNQITSGSNGQSSLGVSSGGSMSLTGDGQTAQPSQTPAATYYDHGLSVANLNAKEENALKAKGVQYTVQRVGLYDSEIIVPKTTTVTVPATPLTAGEQQAVAASGVDQTDPTAVAAVKLLYDGIQNADPKNPLTDDQALAQTSAEIAQIKSGAKAFGVDLNHVIADLANNTGYGKVEQAILKGINDARSAQGKPPLDSAGLAQELTQDTKTLQQQLQPHTQTITQQVDFNSLSSEEQQQMMSISSDDYQEMIQQSENAPEEDPNEEAPTDPSQISDSELNAYKQYYASRIAAAQASYDQAQSDIALLKKNCPKCTNISDTPVPVQGVQGAFTVTATVPTTQTVGETPDQVLQNARDYLYSIYKPDPVTLAKDQAAAAHAHMSLEDYVVGGINPQYAIVAANAFQTMQKQGTPVKITSGFRDNYRQSLVDTSGAHASVGNSWHGNSNTTTGYGDGLAIDVAPTDGSTWSTVTSWIDKNGKEYGIARPYANSATVNDPGHIGPASGPETVKRDPSDKRSITASQENSIYTDIVDSAGKTVSGPAVNVAFNTLTDTQKAQYLGESPAQYAAQKNSIETVAFADYNDAYPVTNTQVAQAAAKPVSPISLGDTEAPATGNTNTKPSSPVQPSFIRNIGTYVSDVGSFISNLFTGSGSSNTSMPPSTLAPGSDGANNRQQASTTGMNTVTPSATDLTVTANSATVSTSSQYLLQGTLTRTVSGDSTNSDTGDLLVTDLHDNYASIIDATLNIDYQCDGTIDVKKSFTVPYRSFSPDNAVSSVLLSQYVPLSQPGTYCFYYSVDTTNQVIEENEQNNVSNAVRFTVENN